MFIGQAKKKKEGSVEFGSLQSIYKNYILNIL